MGERIIVRMPFATVQSPSQSNREVPPLQGLHQTGQMVRAAVRGSKEVVGGRQHHEPPVLFVRLLRARREFCVCERRCQATSACTETVQVSPAAGAIFNRRPPR